jgi:hypothetical protein
MKKSNLLLFVIVFLMIMQSCKKEETGGQTPTPTETKSFVAYIDGVKFSPNIANVYIDTIRDGNYLIKTLTAEIGDRSIAIQFTSNITGSFALTGGTSGYDVGKYYVGSDSSWICTSSVGGGNLVISKHDKANNKISGTFNFKAKIFGSSNIKNITNGEFFDVGIR